MNKPPRERILDRVLVDSNGCWLWQRARHKTTGYAVITLQNRQRLAHRAAYELFVGPIPEGLTIDHLCRVKHCVNPEHLEPVTMRENTLRGESPAALNAQKELCKRGHTFDRVDAAGRRVCRRCKSDLQRAARRKAAVA